MTDSVTIRLKSGESSQATDSSHEENGQRIITSSKLSNDTLASVSSISTISLEISPDDSSSASSFAFDPLSLACLVPHLSKNGTAKIVIKLPKELDASSIHTAILLAGLTASSEKTEQGGSVRVITSTYKPVKTSTVEKIRLPPISSGPVRINLDGCLDDDDDDLLEDDLLNDTTNNHGNGILNAPPVVDTSNRVKDDCDGRKPCDDCTCGRAEMENGGSGGIENERKIVKDIKSSCGNCAKGDAFRCAGCPFLGKPAFKEGEEHLVLDLDDDL